HAASGHAAEPPSKVMNSRRRMSCPRTGPNSSTSSDGEGAVHRSEILPPMSAWGHLETKGLCLDQVRFASISRNNSAQLLRRVRADIVAKVFSTGDQKFSGL